MSCKRVIVFRIIKILPSSIVESGIINIGGLHLIKQMYIRYTTLPSDTLYQEITTEKVVLFSFTVIHTVGNVGIFVLLIFENK